MTRPLGIAFFVVITVSSPCFGQPAKPAERPIATDRKAVAQPQKGSEKDRGHSNKTPSIAPQPSSPVDEEARKQARENIEINRKLAEYTGDLVALNRWLVIATLVSAVLLFGSAAIQAWVARDTEKRQLRAYVVNQITTIENFAEVANGTAGPKIRMATFNCGQTPAYDVRERYGVFLGDHPLKPDAQLALTAASETRATLAPNMPMPGSLHVAQPPTPAELELLRAGAKVLYIYGEITYADIFRKKHVTKWCVMYPDHIGHFGESNRTGISGTGNFAT